MQSVVLSPLHTSLPTAPARSLATDLLQGRIATATVKAILDIGSYQVELEGRSLNLRLPMQLAVGDAIRLQLDNRPEGAMLKVTQPDTPTTTAMGRLLAQALPRQASNPPALADSLQRILGNSDAASAQPALNQMRGLLALLPSSSTLGKAETLAQWLSAGGLMLERRLAELTPAERSRLPTHDFKAALLRLNAALVQSTAPAPASTKAQPPATSAHNAGPGTPAAPQTAATATTGRNLPPATGSADPAVAVARTDPATGPLPGRPPSGTQSGPGTPGAIAPNRAAPAEPGQTGNRANPGASMPDAPAAAGKSPRGKAPVQAVAAGAGDQAGPAEETPLERLRSQIESSLSHLHLNQARLIQTQAEGQPQWTLEIPLSDEELGRHLRLSVRDQRQRPAHENGWSAELVLEPAALGPLRVRLHLIGDSLRTVIWAVDAKASALLNEALPLLDAALAQTGLQVIPSCCYQGQAPALSEEFDRGFLDLRA